MTIKLRNDDGGIDLVAAGNVFVLAIGLVSFALFFVLLYAQFGLPSF